MDATDKKLTEVQEALRKVIREVETLRNQRVIQVIDVNKVDWTPPVEEIHKCLDTCSENVCEVTEEEVIRAHRKAQRQVEWLSKYLPLKGDDL